jgi:probable rRNA maturation factor
MPRAELSIVLTTDRQIQKLNKLYRKKNKPTDVLSFGMRDGEFGERAGRLLGDVVISIPTARRQAREKGVSLAVEVTELLAHGLLHLLGWDHRTDREEKRMRAKTASLVSGARR